MNFNQPYITLRGFVDEDVHVMYYILFEKLILIHCYGNSPWKVGIGAVACNTGCYRRRSPVRTRVGLKLTLSSDSLCHFSTALTYRIRKAGTIANVLIWDLPLAQFPILW